MELRSVVAASVLLAACASESPLTEIVVVVDSDLSVPDQLDEIHIEVTGLASGPQSATKTLAASASDLPGVLGVVHRGGPLGPVSITATGRAGGADVVTRSASTSFIEGKSIVVRLDLLAACVGVGCDSGQTCADNGACIGVDVDPATLPEWTGRAPRLLGEDAGGIDAGAIDGGEIDAGEDRDAGPPPVDGGIDAGPPDAGRPDAGPPDAGPPPRTCDDIYGGAPGYMLCDMMATSCEFQANTGGSNCNAMCTRFGGTCINAFDNSSSTGKCTRRGTADDCTTNRGSEICICTR